MFASQSLMALKLDQQDILHNILFNSPCNPFPKQILQQLSLSDFMMKGCCKCMENRFSRFHSARLSCLLAITMLSIICSFAFHSILKQSSVRSIIFNAMKLLFKQSFFVKYLNVKYLHVMSMLCTTEWWSELTTWSQKMNLLHILSTPPHCLHKHCIWARKENFNFDLRVCYLLRHKWHQLRKSRENDFLRVVIIGRFFVMNLCCS